MIGSFYAIVDNLKLTLRHRHRTYIYLEAFLNIKHLWIFWFFVYFLAQFWLNKTMVSFDLKLKQLKKSVLSLPQKEKGEGSWHEVTPIAVSQITSCYAMLK